MATISEELGWLCISRGAGFVVSDGQRCGASPSDAHAGVVVQSTFVFSAAAASASSPPPPLLATVGDDKVLKLWACEAAAAATTLTLRCVGTFPLARRPMNIAVARIAAAGATHTTLIVGDRAGDVYAFSIDGVLAAWPSACDAATLPTRWMLGHTAAMVSAVLPVVDNTAGSAATAIVTADREGKLRISELPAASIIRCFCLGHSSVVTDLVMLDDHSLCSASGDGTLRVWELATGRQLESHRVADAAPAAAASAAASASAAAAAAAAAGAGAHGAAVEEEEEQPASPLVVAAFAFDAVLGVLAVAVDGCDEVLVYRCAAEGDVDAAAPRLRYDHAVSVGGGVRELAFAPCSDGARALLVLAGNGVVSLSWDASAARLAPSPAGSSASDFAALLLRTLPPLVAAPAAAAAAAAAIATTVSRWSSAEFVPKLLAKRFDPAAKLINKRKKKRRKRSRTG